jgi:hypothetical protein
LRITFAIAELGGAILFSLLARIRFPGVRLTGIILAGFALSASSDLSIQSRS